METSATGLPRRLAILTAAAVMTIATQFAFADETIAPARYQTPDDMFRVEIDQDLLDKIDAALPESRAVDSAFLNPDYSPNLTISMDTQISVTAIDEGAGYRNSFGYFSYDLNTFSGLSKADVDVNLDGNISLTELDSVDGVEAGWAFPNFSMAGKGGQLRTGDTTWLGGGEIFEEGQTVGFFVAQNAWQRGSTSMSDSTANFYSLDFLNPEADSDAMIGSYQAGSLSRHTAALFADEKGTEVIFGFEDLNRENRYANPGRYPTDEDFNDAIFVVRSNPVGAFSNSDIAVAPISEPGMIGAAGLLMIPGFAGWIRRRRSNAS